MIQKLMDFFARLMGFDGVENADLSTTKSETAVISNITQSTLQEVCPTCGKPI